MRGFYEIAAADPGRPAVAGLTYGELLGRVNQASNGLVALGCAPGDTVVTVLPNGADAITMMLATYQIGVYLVPVNWHYTAEEIGYILADCSAVAAVTCDAFAAAVPAVTTRFVGLDRLLDGRPATAPAHRRAGSMMLYTSGTTGKPKGVRRRLLDLTPEELHPILTRKSWRHFGLPQDGVHLVASQLYHSAPYGQAMMALHSGHTIVAPERFDAAEALELIERHRVTNTFMVPTMFHRMLALPRGEHDLTSLTHLYHGAAPCPPATKQAMIEWLGPVLWEYYGSTEAAVATMVSSQEWLAKPGTVGRALDGMAFTILDDDSGELPAGEPGLVYIGGINRFEYHKDPAKTASTMHGRLYTPGDIGYLDEDGYLFLCDRRTDLIISGGVNIYPAEIEAVLLEHPSVADVAVIGVPDQEWGHRVVALVEPEPASSPGPELTAALLEHCAPRLARLKHPRLIEYRERLPRTPTGKLSRSGLRDGYLGDERG
jgi:long-chain acyl-CoA synthetase